MSYYDVDWSPRFGFGWPRSLSGLRGVCIHTTENQPGTPAENIAQYQINTETGSYHVLVDSTGKRLRENTDDWATYSTGNQGNNILVHLSFVFFAGASRAQWLAQDKMLRAGATVVAHWCRTYKWPVKQVNVNGLPGITTHDATRVWGSTDHWDPGPNFPWDVFLRYVNEAMKPAPAPAPEPTPKEDVMAADLNTQIEVKGGAKYRAQDLIKWTDERVYDLTREGGRLDRIEGTQKRIESKLDRLLADGEK